MMQLGPLGFAAPWLLLGLIALPILWWLLRATPPAPVRERFPGVTILMGLEPPEKTPERTPWWLLLLRLLIAGLAIIAFAQPLLNPRGQMNGEGPVRLILDDGWASAQDWNTRLSAAGEIIERADRAGRGIELITLAQVVDPEREGEILGAADAKSRLDVLTPVPWSPDRAALYVRLGEAPTGDTVWIHDGLDHAEQFGPLAERLASGGQLQLIGPQSPVKAVTPAGPEATGLTANVLRAQDGAEEAISVIGYSAEDDGARQAIALAQADFAIEDRSAEAEFDVPLELRNRIAAFGLEGAEHAGAVALVDARWRRQRVGLVSGERPEGNQRLLSGTHYLRNALAEAAELREAPLGDLLAAEVDTIVLVDVGAFPEAEAEALQAWVEGGGLLVRFAGPALASSIEESRFEFGQETDPLLPVRLRPGGRDLGGAMSWGAPQRLAAFPEGSPFNGMQPPADARIAKQVLAEPDIDLPGRTWASLSDGAPFVTSDARGEGRIVLIHTTADPRWSTLPLSGLFLEMLDRIIKNGTGGGAKDAPSTGLWSPIALIGADGVLRRAPETASSVEADILIQGASAAAPPGVYRSVSGEGEGAIRAHNLLTAEAQLAAAPPPPDSALVETLGERRETPLKPWFLAVALALFLVDAIAAFALAGKLRLPVGAAMFVLAGFAAIPSPVQAQEEDPAIRAALDGALAFVQTRDSETDRVAEAGLRGLTRSLITRTSIEPADPVGVNLETDELAVFPLIYWAIAENQPRPSSDAIAKLNEFMRRGGMLVIDTRDQNLAIGNAETPGIRTLRRLTDGLDLPPLSPIPEGHVLRRSFYLLDEFGGRWNGGNVWVEAAPPEDLAEIATEGGGFKNDGVTPIVVGSHDWIGAWAINEDGNPLLPVGGRGASREREMALRFGINLVMYAYTGSYKSDQVHVPALLQRLGQ